MTRTRSDRGPCWLRPVLGGRPDPARVMRMFWREARQALDNKITTHTKPNLATRPSTLDTPAPSMARRPRRPVAGVLLGGGKVCALSKAGAGPRRPTTMPGRALLTVKGFAKAKVTQGRANIMPDSTHMTDAGREGMMF